MHHIYTCTLTLSRPPKTSRLDRKFLFGMAALSGLNQKTCRTPTLTMRAQCGDRTSTRCHVAKAFVIQLERMANTASPFSKPYGQAPFWKFLYAWRCRLLSSTSSLFSGNLFSPVRRRIMSILVCQQSSASSHAHTVCCFADEGEGNTVQHDQRVLYFRFSTHSLLVPKPVIIQKPSRPYDLGLRSFVCMDLHYEYMQPSNDYGHIVWVYASIQPPESLV